MIAERKTAQKRRTDLDLPEKRDMGEEDFP